MTVIDSIRKTLSNTAGLGLACACGRRIILSSPFVSGHRTLHMIND